VPGNVSSTGIDQASAATAGAETMEPVDGGGATVVACGGEKGREAHNTSGFLEEQRERSERVTGAGKSTKNSHGCTIHHGRERF
jgi:hypothetical protein